MRLVVDANIVVGELLRLRGQQLMEDHRLDLSIADRMWSEAEHEVGKRVLLMERAGRITNELAQRVRDTALSTARRRLVRVPVADYAHLERVARRRIPRDPNDWQTVALALTIGAGIWTQDADFLGCGLPTWTTDTLLAYLEDEAAGIPPAGMP